MFAPIPTKLIPSRDPKPYRTGAFVLTDQGYFYTAKPEDYRLTEHDQADYPFYQTPEHMRITD